MNFREPLHVGPPAFHFHVVLPHGLRGWG
jgi:hypothetical protein